MTVLVTGGCGYIGAHVVHALHQAGEKVVVVDDLSYGKPTRIEGSRLYGMDIAAPGAGERLAEILDAEGVDSVIHFAARKQVGESVEKPLWYYQQNINGMLNVLTGMTQSKNAKKLVFSSSAATYGVPPVDVVPEDVVPMLPINPYGQTKLFGEWMARACEQPFGIRFCALRYFNVAGCGPVELEDPAILNLIPMLFNRLKQGKAPAIFGDDYPTQRRHRRRHLRAPDRRRSQEGHRSAVHRGCHGPPRRRPAAPDRLPEAHQRGDGLACQVRRGRHRQVRVGCLAGQPRTPHRRRHLEAG